MVEVQLVPGEGKNVHKTSYQTGPQHHKGLSNLTGLRAPRLPSAGVFDGVWAWPAEKTTDMIGGATYSCDAVFAVFYVLTVA